MDYPLQYQREHLLIELASGYWILDTGSPTSFGKSAKLELAGQVFGVAQNLMGLTAGTLSSLSGLDVQGLLGTDILNAFDVLFDLPAERVTLSQSAITLEGVCMPIDMVMGVPTVRVHIKDPETTMFFDTGSSLCYWQDERLTEYPLYDTRKDFFPGVGEFEVTTYQVPFALNDQPFESICGSLPELLGLPLSLLGVDGILGNGFMTQRQVAYLPRRGQLVLA